MKKGGGKGKRGGASKGGGAGKRGGAGKGGGAVGAGPPDVCSCCTAGGFSRGAAQVPAEDMDAHPWGRALESIESYEGPRPEVCCLCRNGAEEVALVLCEYCPAAFHQDCINEPPMHEIPRGAFSCALCNAAWVKNVAEERTKEAARRQAKEAARAQQAKARAVESAERKRQRREEKADLVAEKVLQAKQSRADMHVKNSFGSSHLAQQQQQQAPLDLPLVFSLLQMKDDDDDDDAPNAPACAAVKARLREILAAPPAMRGGGEDTDDVDDDTDTASASSAATEDTLMSGSSSSAAGGAGTSALQHHAKMCMAGKDVITCFASHFDAQAERLEQARVEAVADDRAANAAVLPSANDLVFAHMTGYGWWPGVVDSGPSLESDEKDEEEKEEEEGGGGRVPAGKKGKKRARSDGCHAVRELADHNSSGKRDPFPATGGGGGGGGGGAAGARALAAARKKDVAHGGGGAAAATGTAGRGKQVQFEIRWVNAAGGASFTKTPLDKIVPFASYFSHKAVREGAKTKAAEGWEKDVELACKLLLGTCGSDIEERGLEILGQRKRWNQRVSAFGAFLAEKAGVTMVMDGSAAHFRPEGGGKVPEPELFAPRAKCFFMREGKSHAGVVEVCRPGAGGVGVDCKIHSETLTKFQNERNWVPQLRVLPRTPEVSMLLKDLAFFLWVQQDAAQEGEQARLRAENALDGCAAAGGGGGAGEAGGSAEGGSAAEDGGGGARAQAAEPSRFRALQRATENMVLRAIESHDPAQLTTLFACDVSLNPTVEMLHHAVRRSTTPMLKALLLLHVNVAEMLRHAVAGSSLLHVAVELGALAKVEALLAEGADALQPTTGGWATSGTKSTVLHLAAMKGRAPILRVLLRHISTQHAHNPAVLKKLVDKVDAHGYTALQWCSEYTPGSAPCAALLLDAGADIDKEDPQKRTTLWWAASKGQCDLIQLLVARGASHDAFQRRGFERDISLGICANVKIPIQPRRAAASPSPSPRKNKATARAKKTARPPAAAGGAAAARDHFANFRKFVFVDRSIGDVRDNRKCCAHVGPCTSENKCPCAMKNAERMLTPYNVGGRLDVEHGQESLVIIECTDACRCAHEECQISKVRRGLTKQLRVEWAGAKGWGVFAREQIYKGEFVVSYAGEVLSRAVTEAREEQRCNEGLVDTYLIEVSTHWSIDGTHVGNVSRLFNHSCAPNLAHKKVDIGNKCPTVAFFASRDIAEGEELTWSYSSKYNKQAHSSTECKCGADECRHRL